MRKIVLAALAASIALPAAPAFAQDWGSLISQVSDRRDDRRYDDRRYDERDGRAARSDQVWRGADGRYYCRKPNGTTGMLIGGAAGALLGREVDGGRDRTLGTVLGAAGGALLGREVERGRSNCR